jgi:acid phosphatase type 7
MRRVGIVPRPAAEMLQNVQTGGEGFQALPQPSGPFPYRVSSAALEIPPSPGQGRTFHVIGDSGGVKDPNPQLAVAKALAADLLEHPEVGFLYHVGDIDYLEGADAEYAPQFFEAYADYLRHIVGIPGNRDGAGGDHLASFMAYLCDTSPRLLPQFAEYQRDTMTQPNCYWTLEDPAVTIVGLYSNVPSGGEIQQNQREWFVEELRAARERKPLIVALHHPPFSVDAHHGGSANMWTLLTECFKEAGRYPALMLAGHVHDYQRFSIVLEGHAITGIVIGNGGYHYLHPLAADAKAGEELAEGVTFEYGDASGWGFLRLGISSEDGVDNVIRGEYVGVPREGEPQSADTFTLEGPF